MQRQSKIVRLRRGRGKAKKKKKKEVLRPVVQVHYGLYLISSRVKYTYINIIKKKNFILINYFYSSFQSNKYL